MALTGSNLNKTSNDKAPEGGVSIDLENGYELLVPSNIIDKIHENIKNDPDRLRGHLVRALKIGLLAIEGGEFTLSTERIENAMTSTIGKFNDFDERFEKNLSSLIDQKLTGSDSLLASRLRAAFGENGELKTRMDTIFDDISNPEKTKSVPNRVSEVMQIKFDGIESEITSALDLAKEDSPLRSFLNEQRTNFNNLKNDMEKELKRIQDALNVDEVLQKKEAEIADLKDKSTHKGFHFENDAVDALMDVAGVLGDRIDHTGGEGEGASRSKVGDIVITIIHAGIPEIRIAVEAKAGGIARKELLRQVRNGVQNRSAICGIGLMERKHMGITQSVVEKEAENYIVGVDWANDDFLSLEVMYRSLRIQLVADALRQSQSTDSIDIDGIQKAIEQAKVDLGMLQGMKSQTSTAIGTLEGVRANMDILQKKVIAQLKEAEGLLNEE
tara:strand:+ start:108 stop:1436 length:1329 start_codon:yes stop_codon:yes gene_type:complete